MGLARRNRLHTRDPSRRSLLHSRSPFPCVQLDLAFLTSPRKRIHDTPQHLARVTN